MSRFDELISAFCPDGVELKALGDVGTLIRGKRFVKADMVEAGVPCIHYGEIYTKYGVAATTSISFLTENRAKTLRYAQPGDVILASAGETIEDIGKSVAWLGNEPIVIHDACYAFSGSLDPKFVSYFFASRAFRDQIRQHISSSKISSISTQSMAKARIPLPPREVQIEIVRILDQFTELQLQLESELEARRQQYDYYAELLLVNDDEVPRVKFGEVATIVRGASPRPIQKFIAENGDGFPWIKIGDVPARGKYITATKQRVSADGAAKSRRVGPGDFVLSNSMSFGRPYISQIEGYIHDGWLAISGFQDSFVPDYLYYLLRSASIQQEFARRAGAGTVKNLNAEIVRSIDIPLPPKETQERVVDLLDRFDALVNDVHFGLPAEVAARRKQYEHYRDRLMTFQEATA